MFKTFFGSFVEKQFKKKKMEAFEHSKFYTWINKIYILLKFKPGEYHTFIKIFLKFQVCQLLF